MDLVRHVGEAVAPASEQFGVFKVSKHRDARFRREIRALTALGHPNLVKVLAVDNGEEPAWYLMEYFPKGTLQDQWADYKGQVLEVLLRARGVAEALSIVHERGIIHRDLKPENIFLASDGRWVLGDFGIAFDANDERLTQAQERPPMNRWFRPDWAMARQVEPGPTYDIFQLAMIIYAMIAGPGKCPPASQLDEPEFALVSLLKGDERVGVVQEFLMEHITTLERNVKSRTARELVKRLDELIASFVGRINCQQVLSWFSSHSVSSVSAEDLWRLQNLRVLLPKGASLLKGTLRIRAGNESPVERSGLLQLSLRKEETSTVERARLLEDPDRLHDWESAALARWERNVTVG